MGERERIGRPLNFLYISKEITTIIILILLIYRNGILQLLRLLTIFGSQNFSSVDSRVSGQLTQSQCWIVMLHGLHMIHQLDCVSFL